LTKLSDIWRRSHYAKNTDENIVGEDVAVMG
jgi:hypothetical protein